MASTWRLGGEPLAGWQALSRPGPGGSDRRDDRARLTEPKGQVGRRRLSSGTREIAAITLRGRSADTALLDISCAFNPTAHPLALACRLAAA